MKRPNVTQLRSPAQPAVDAMARRCAAVAEWPGHWLGRIQARREAAHEVRQTAREASLELNHELVAGLEQLAGRHDELAAEYTRRLAKFTT